MDVAKLMSADEREVAAVALQSIPVAEETQIANEWQVLARQRLADITTGRVSTVSGRETMQMARDRSRFA